MRLQREKTIKLSLLATSCKFGPSYFVEFLPGLLYFCYVVYSIFHGCIRVMHTKLKDSALALLQVCRRPISKVLKGTLEISKDSRQ